MCSNRRRNESDRQILLVYFCAYSNFERISHDLEEPTKQFNLFLRKLFKFKNNKQYKKLFSYLAYWCYRWFTITLKTTGVFYLRLWWSKMFESTLWLTLNLNQNCTGRKKNKNQIIRIVDNRHWTMDMDRIQRWLHASQFHGDATKTLCCTNVSAFRKFHSTLLCCMKDGYCVNSNRNVFRFIRTFYVWNPIFLCDQSDLL